MRHLILLLVVLLCGCAASIVPDSLRANPQSVRDGQGRSDDAYRAWSVRGDVTPGEVTAALGNPKAIFTLKDGSSSWEYPTSPQGLTTTLVRFDAKGTLLYVSQVLTDENLQRIHNGMSEEAVRASIGPPWRKVPFERQRQTAWDYLYRDTWGYRVEFSVLFNPAGEVVGKTSHRLDDSRNDLR